MADQTQTTRLDHAADEVQQPTGPEVAKLVARLTSDPQMRLVNFGVFRGDGPATAEDIARECNQALSQEEAGTALVSTAFDDQRPTIDVREYLESLP